MLIDELAEARVGDPEIEGEAAGAQMLVRHDCDPRGQPARKAKADAAELPEIMVGGEDQRAGLGAHPQRHSETAAAMLPAPRWAGEALGRSAERPVGQGCDSMCVTRGSREQ